MPKILINEENLTSAGTPGRYGNYAVLLAGFMGTPAEDESKHQKADENGVYEFNSAQAFKDTIGVTGSEVDHSGNRMAYELLNLGYQVIYKVIKEISEMADESFWSVFKDKASYDFRFISHGLLNSKTDAEYMALYDKRAAMEADLQLLESIEEEAGIKKGQEDFKMSEIKACDDIFAAKIAKGNFGNFSSDTVYSVPYKLYHVAAGFTIPEGVDLNNLGESATQVGKKNSSAGIAGDKAIIEDSLKAKDKTALTVGVYNEINSNIAKLASYRANAASTGRGDCIALIELDENEYTADYLKATNTDGPEALIINGINRMPASIGENGKYCALTVPSVSYRTSQGIEKFPAAFHYLACFMNALNSGFAEWYAAAGYTRGVSSYIIDHTTVKLGEIAINALEPRYKEQNPNKAQPKFACNVIVYFRGSYYLWGNRTAALLGEGETNDLTAEHFLNIRQLCSTIKKQLYVSCRRFTFDPNSDTLWVNFVNSIIPTLDLMKGDQGIRDYKIIKVATSKKATLKAKIRIIPIEAVEDFEIAISLEDSFGETSVIAD